MMKRSRLDPKNPPRLTAEEARRLDRMKDEDIDYSDIPELGDEFFSRAKHPAYVGPLVPNRETIEAMKAAERGEVTTVGHPRNLLKSLNADGFLTLGELARDPWSVLRGLLPPNADVALLLAAREATYRALDRIMAAERRDGLNEVTAWLLELAHLSAIGRLAMLDNWRGQLTGTGFCTTSPYGEDTDYARAMRLRPEKLAEIIAIVNDDERP